MRNDRFENFNRQRDIPLDACESSNCRIGVMKGPYRKIGAAMAGRRRWRRQPARPCAGRHDWARRPGKLAHEPERETRGVRMRPAGRRDAPHRRGPVFRRLGLRPRRKSRCAQRGRARLCPSSLRSSGAAAARRSRARLAGRPNLHWLYVSERPGRSARYAVAAGWLYQAAEQGAPTAQFLLGLLFDKGYGVPQDWVQAEVWLNLAASQASGGHRDYWARIRDAVAQKLTLDQLAEAQRRAYEWAPVAARAPITARY